MARTKTRTVTGIAADDNGIALAQNMVGGTALTLEAAASGLSPPRRLSFDASASIAATIFTIVGLDRNGRAISETVTGVTTSPVATTSVFASVTSITPDTTDAVNTVIVGWTDEVISAPVMLNHYRNPFNVGLGVVVTGTISYTVQHTFSDLQAAGTVDGDGVWFDHATLAALATNTDGNYAFAVEAIRLVVTGGTGTAVLRVIQSGP